MRGHPASAFIRFGSWAQRLGRTPTVAEIRTEYPDLPRATAYRWRCWLLEAWGIEEPGVYLVTRPAPTQPEQSAA